MSKVFTFGDASGCVAVVAVLASTQYLFVTVAVTRTGVGATSYNRQHTLSFKPIEFNQIEKDRIKCRK